MSSAHRPTWNAAEGRADERHKSARVAARHMPSHTKLKFRQPQQGGQASSQIHRDDRVRRDLRKELELAERESRNKRRKQQGLAPEKEDISEEDAEEEQGKVLEDRSVEDEDLKRRKLIEEMKKLDEDDVDSDSGSSEQASKNKGKAKATNGVSDSSDDSSSSDDDDDDEDETAALLRELEKIKRERAEEKARQERERAQMEQSSREDEIALGNPLLNLENAMKGGSGKSRGSNGVASFGVKRRWDDDVVFKNQAAGNEKEKDGFVNDLTSEYKCDRSR
jgi:protein CWC15